MKLLLLLSLLFLSPAAHAGGLAEPYLGAEVGKFVADVTYGSRTLLSVSDTYRGPAFGFRAGIGLGPFVLGPDLALAVLTTSKSGSAAPVDLGVLFGLFPGPVRIWASYFPYSKVTDLKGSAVKGGVGFRILPHVSVNGEYVSRKFTLYASSLPGVSVSGTFKSYLLTVGFPFSFNGNDK